MANDGIEQNNEELVDFARYGRGITIRQNMANQVGQAMAERVDRDMMNLASEIDPGLPVIALDASLRHVAAEFDRLENVQLDARRMVVNPATNFRPGEIISIETEADSINYLDPITGRMVSDSPNIRMVAISATTAPRKPAAEYLKDLAEAIKA